MYWRNSDFQIRHFIAGACETPDEAYRVLLMQLREREDAIASSRAARLRSQAKRLRIEEAAALAANEADRLDVLAELLELDHQESHYADMLAGATHERDTIRAMLDELAPKRRYAHLGELEAHQAAQREEWKLKFIRRIENYLATTGVIPTDELTSMRQHPDFEQVLRPAIESTMRALETRGFQLKAAPALLESGS